MRHLFRCFLIVALVLAATCAQAGFIVKATKNSDSAVRVEVPKVALLDSVANGEKVVFPTLPEGRALELKGLPALPVMSALVMVSPVKNPSLKVVKGEFVDLKVEARVLPSKGPLTRDINPDSVPFSFDATVYGKDAWYPADNELVTLEQPFTFRDIRGARVQVLPVQYNPAKGLLRVYKSFDLQIVNDKPGVDVIKSPIRISREFEPIYARHFINFKLAAKRLPRLPENGRLFIIALDELVEPMMPFVVWRQKSGVETKIVKVSEIGGATIANIQAAIKAEYQAGNLTNVMLVGDAPALPTPKGQKENADSDPCYTKLAGDDHVPDCIISRISATTKDEVAYQVAKFINYEQFPSTGANAAWYKKAMGIASSEGSPTDFERCNWLRDALLKGNTMTSVDQIYDPSAPKAKVAEGINEGRSLINYIGHGSKTMWVSSRFDVNDCKNLLSNGWKLPFIVSVACVNGQFVGPADCFAEAFMKAGNIDSPKGAAVITAASTNMEWVPPCIVQSEITVNYIVNDTYKTAGGLHVNGIIKGLEQYGIEPKKSGVMMVEQWHIFGDGSLRLRFKEPVPVTVTTTSAAADEARAVTVVVKDAEGKAVANATVTCYSERLENLVAGTTNENGEATLKVKVAEKTDGYVTVTGNNLVPVVDQKLTF